MYRAHRPAPEKGVTHHAVIDYDDVFGLYDHGGPVVFEIVEQPGLRARPLEPNETWAKWRIADQAGARKRIELLWNSPERHTYDALFNNCEHVATFIEAGEFRSEQVRQAIALGAAVGVVAWIARGAK